MEKQVCEKILNDFNWKADTLRGSPLTRCVFSIPEGTPVPNDLGSIGSTLKISERRPSDYDIHSFILTFRLFIQNNEKISIVHLSKVYANPFIDSSLSGRFKKTQQAINDYLNEGSIIDNKAIRKALKGLKSRKPRDILERMASAEGIKRRNILETYIFGMSAHINDSKRNTWAEWTKPMFASGMFLNELLLILAQMMRAILQLKNLNEETLNQFTL